MKVRDVIKLIEQDGWYQPYGRQEVIVIITTQRNPEPLPSLVIQGKTFRKAPRIAY